MLGDRAWIIRHGMTQYWFLTFYAPSVLKIASKSLQVNSWITTARFGKACRLLSQPQIVTIKLISQKLESNQITICRAITTFKQHDDESDHSTTIGKHFYGISSPCCDKLTRKCLPQGCRVGVTRSQIPKNCNWCQSQILLSDSGILIQSFFLHRCVLTHAF